MSLAERRGGSSHSSSSTGCSKDGRLEDAFIDGRGGLRREHHRGNPTEVKVVLASVVLALACYQLVLIAVGYGKARVSFLEARPAARAHRASVERSS